MHVEYQDQAWVVRDHLDRFMAGPFDTETEAINWIACYLHWRSA